MNNEEKRTKVITMIDDLYGNEGMAVVNLLTDYMSEDNWGSLYDRLERDGQFKEPEPDDELDYSPTMREALGYVMEQLGPEAVAAIAAKVDENFKQDLNPSEGIDDSRIIDLLEEYGENEELPEGWWKSECEMDDIVLLMAHES